jgi:hypothetical protein
MASFSRAAIAGRGPKGEIRVVCRLGNGQTYAVKPERCASVAVFRGMVAAKVGESSMLCLR